MEEQILEMLNELRPEFDYTSSDDFVMDGMLDSFDIVSLCNMLEEKYNIIVDGMDIVPENFASINSISALVKNSKEKK